MRADRILLPEADAGRRGCELRTGHTPSLRHRRRAATLAIACGGVMGFLSLYQLGVVHRLPDLPLPGFDAERVDGSAQAYEILGLPDATMATVSYALTLLLAGTGGERPARWQAGLLAGKASFDAAYAAKLVVDQATRHRAACWYCLLSAAMTGGTLVEALRALREARP
jgi:uncharacterized membrane protein